MSYFPCLKTNSFTIYVSRNAAVGDIQVRIVNSLLSKSSKNHSIANLIEWSRIWKLGSESTSDSIQDVKDMI